MRIDETICRLLEKNPEKRFPDALVLLRHLEQIVRLEDFAATGVTLYLNRQIDATFPAAVHGLTFAALGQSTSYYEGAVVE